MAAATRGGAAAAIVRAAIASAVALIFPAEALLEEAAPCFPAVLAAIVLVAIIFAAIAGTRTRANRNFLLDALANHAAAGDRLAGRDADADRAGALIRDFARHAHAVRGSHALRHAANASHRAGDLLRLALVGRAANLGGNLLANALAASHTPLFANHARNPALLHFHLRAAIALAAVVLLAESLEEAGLPALEGRPPALGEHTDAWRRELGLAAA